MIKYIAIISAVLILARNYGNAQDQVFPVRGKVIDSGTRTPLRNVSISMSGTLQGAISDSSGRFSLQASGANAILHVSLLGYDKKTIIVNEGLKDTLTVALVKKENVLGEVTVSAVREQVVSKGKRYNVLDYDFYGDDILLITYVDLKKARLLLLSPQSDTLGIRPIPGEPSRLFKDCLGNLHVVCRDSIYQTYYNGKAISLLSGKSIADFEKILLPCVTQDSSSLYLEAKIDAHAVTDYFKPYKSNSYGVIYTSIHKKTRARVVLAVIRDEKTIKWQAEETYRQDQKQALALYKNSPRWAENHFAETIVFSEIYAPLLNIKNSIYIFDFVNDRLLYCGQARKLIREVPIRFHKSIQFAREIKVDAKTGKAFALYESNGFTELREVNLDTGETTSSYKIPFPFVSCVKVQDRNIYFIRHSKEQEDIYYLTRLMIE